MVITKEELQKQFREFLNGYNIKEHNLVWQKQSQIFRNFWKGKILSNDTSEISEEEMDPIIKILDWRAKEVGEFKKSGGECVAATNIRQPIWYKMFRDLKRQKDIQQVLGDIFDAKDDEDKIGLINKLKLANQTNRNGLTGEQGCALNALLFAFNPGSCVCMVSLRHRLMLIKRFELDGIASYDNYSFGERIIKTNNLITNGFRKKYGIDVSPRALTQFLYEAKGVKDFWQN